MGTAIRYFLLTLGSVAVGIASAVAIQVVVWPIERYAVEFIQSTVPTDFAIGITKGKLHINKPLPYTVHWPSMIQNGGSDTSYPGSLAVFLSDADIPNPRALSGYDAVVIATETTLYVKDKNTSYRAIPIDATTEIRTTTQTDMVAGVQTAMAHPIVRYRLYVIVTFFAVLLGLFFGVGLWYVLTLTWYTTVLDLINRAFHINTDVSWTDEYRLLVFFHMPLVGIVTLFHTIFFHAVTGMVFTFFMVGWGIWALKQLSSPVRVVTAKSAQSRRRPPSSKRK
jgi:hypothetical protein